MDLAIEQALALAPDASSVTAGRKLAKPGVWHGLGQDDAAFWGECQGSKPYQTRVDRSDYATKCSCPSRKFPCKHALGLLLLAATSPEALPRSDAPEWVQSWLNQRSQRAARADDGARAKPAAGSTREPRRQERRLERVRAGVEALDLWLEDVMRNGLAHAGMQPVTYWDQPAARLVDAQAPGLASRVRRLAALPNSSPDWPVRLLEDLGKLTLLTHAFARIDELDPALQVDVRTNIGWTIERDEVLDRGNAVTDEWLVIGQRVVPEERLRTQRTWLIGVSSGRTALILQFAHGSASFAEAVAPGTRFAADLAYFPSAFPQRALIRERQGSPRPMRPADASTIGGSIDAALAIWAQALARQPWIERIPVILRAVVPIIATSGDWVVRGSSGEALPLEGSPHWTLLAYSGGRPVDLVAEWNGQSLAPLGVFVADEWRSLPERG